MLCPVSAEEWQQMVHLQNRASDCNIAMQHGSVTQHVSSLQLEGLLHAAHFFGNRHTGCCAAMYSLLLLLQQTRTVFK